MKTFPGPVGQDLEEKGKIEGETYLVEKALEVLRKEAGVTPPPPNPRSLADNMKTKGDADEWARADDAELDRHDNILKT